MEDGVTRPPDRIRVRRSPKKGRYERDTVEAILDRALVAHVAFVESVFGHEVASDHPLSCVQGVACFELGVRANAQVQPQGNQIGAAAKPPQSADPLSAATICRVAWSNSREAVVPRE